MLGKWIDSLTDAERDRIVQHPDPTYSGGQWWSDYLDCGCLVGCVVGAEMRSAKTVVQRIDKDEKIWRFVRRHDRPACSVGIRFPELTGRFGAERMWRLCKARAAKANRVPVPERETVAA